MKKFCLFPIVGALLLALGCATAINTKDVTKVTVTTTGIKIGQSAVDKTPQLVLGRDQVEYIKVPTGANLCATNTASGQTTVSDTPNVTSSYEVNAHSAVFGNAAMTSTFAVGGSNAVNTQVGGAHLPINDGTGTGNKNPTTSYFTGAAGAVAAPAK